MMSSKKEEPIDLPPGFRFHPTDEELITHYLVERVKDNNFSPIAIGEADLNKCEPWDLPGKAIMGEKEWYFFCKRDRKYPTGMRTNRATQSGYWKATGKDKEIFKGKGCLVGMKKTLVFYKGRAPKGDKTNWVMHEYRLEGKSSFWNLPRSFKDDWVVSRIFHKNTGLKNTSTTQDGDDDGDDEQSNLPSLMESSPYQMNNTGICSNYNIQIHDGIHSNSTTSSSYMNPNINYYHNNNMGYNPYFYPQIQAPTIAYSGFHGAVLTRTPSPIIRQHCKIEQYSNPSTMSGSPETSVVSRQEIGDTIVSSSTSAALVDFDNLLNTYS